MYYYPILTPHFQSVFCTNININVTQDNDVNVIECMHIPIRPK